MKKYAKIAWAVVAIITLYLAWPFNKPDISTPDIEYEKTLIDSLRTVISKMDSDRVYYDITIDHLKDSINILKSRTKQEHKTINELKRKVNEKVNTATKFSSDEYVKFLSDRYKDSVGVK